MPITQKNIIITILCALIVFGTAGYAKSTSAEFALDPVGSASSTERATTSVPIIIINSEGINKKEMRQLLSIKEEQSCLIASMPNSLDAKCADNEEGGEKASTTVQIKAARVTKVGNDFFTIAIFGYAYNVQVVTGAKIIRYLGGLSGVDELSVGDIVNINGTLDEGDNGNIRLKLARNVSLQKRHTTLEGIIESTASSTESFILKTEEYGLQTVLISTSTKQIGSAATEIEEKANLLQESKAMVRGIWDKARARIKAELVVMRAKEVEITKEENKNEEFKKRVDEKINEIRKKATEIIERISP